MTDALEEKILKRKREVEDLANNISKTMHDSGIMTALLALLLNVSNVIEVIRKDGPPNFVDDTMADLDGIVRMHIESGVIAIEKGIAKEQEAENGKPN